MEGRRSTWTPQGSFDAQSSDVKVSEARALRVLRMFTRCNVYTRCHHSLGGYSLMFPSSGTTVSRTLSTHYWNWVFVGQWSFSTPSFPIKKTRISLHVHKKRSHHINSYPHRFTIHMTFLMGGCPLHWLVHGHHGCPWRSRSRTEALLQQSLGHRSPRWALSGSPICPAEKPLGAGNRSAAAQQDQVVINNGQW